MLCCPLQVKTEISVESKHQTLQGLAFPLQESAKRSLHLLAQRRINYVQLVSRKSCVSEPTIKEPLSFLLFILVFSEAGCGKGDDRTGPRQPDRNSWFTPQGSQRHSQISLLPLQALPWRRLPGICWYAPDHCTVIILFLPSCSNSTFARTQSELFSSHHFATMWRNV